MPVLMLYHNWEFVSLTAKLQGWISIMRWYCTNLQVITFLHVFYCYPNKPDITITITARLSKNMTILGSKLNCVLIEICCKIELSWPSTLWTSVSDTLFWCVSTLNVFSLKTYIVVCCQHVYPWESNYIASDWSRISVGVKVAQWMHQWLADHFSCSGGLCLIWEI